MVVGSGQSGAELFNYLMTHYPNADITAAIRRFSYKPVDDSDFTNEIFFPSMVDTLFELADEKRKMILDHCRDVNYAVVDLALIRRIYKCLYQEKVEGRNRARIRTFLKLEDILETGDGVIARFLDVLRDETVTLEADGMILCTGYTWRKNHPLLHGLAPWLRCDGTAATGSSATTAWRPSRPSLRASSCRDFRRDPRRERARAVAPARSGRETSEVAARRAAERGRR